MRDTRRETQVVEYGALDGIANVVVEKASPAFMSGPLRRFRNELAAWQHLAQYYGEESDRGEAL
ncbi:hypothetical protein BN2476_70007 [Paraburkholderia piptadeniae]|uniref:Uncharacterized protein n=1 Tax=Paraburkholderia piptadeniae TaxID=1701573 RepID=A0A1N7RL42_9BURK|nr:hypothetical protein BN2476_70007 [Paraburkholderia piptadeniae]